MRAGRRLVVAAALAGAVVMGVASLAWACIATTGPALDEVSPAEAPAGAAVAVAGSGWDRSAPVDLFFSPDGAAVVQPALATTTAAADGTISAWVTVPQSAPGPHYLVAQQGEVARAVIGFEVSAPAPAAVATTSGVESRSPLASSAATSGAAAGPAAAPAPSLGGAAAPAPAGVPAAAGPAAAEPALPTAVAGAGAAVQPATVEASIPPAPARSESTPRVVTNDLWSGYAVAPAPGLPDLQPAAVPGSGLPSATMAMAVAVVALSAGFAVQEVFGRRRMVRLDGTTVED